MWLSPNYICLSAQNLLDEQTPRGVDNIVIINNSGCRRVAIYRMYVIADINRADVKDTEMEQTINTVVEGLFSYFVTLG